MSTTTQIISYEVKATMPSGDTFSVRVADKGVAEWLESKLSAPEPPPRPAVLDEDDLYTIERAADLLETYAEFIVSDVMSADIERHPYQPEIELTAKGLREIAAAPQPPVEVDPPQPRINRYCWANMCVATDKLHELWCKRYSPQPEATGPSGDKLSDFNEDQWWLAELDAAVANGTPDQKRAVAVVRNLLKTAHAALAASTSE